MLNFNLIISIARRELFRVRSRFHGNARSMLLVVFLVTASLSYLAWQKGATVQMGVYRVGVSPNGPVLADGRFITTTLDPISGFEQLRLGQQDLYIEADRIVARDDDRSQYALGAAKQYLTEQELIRLSESYPPEQAFPLRIMVQDMSVADVVAAGGGSVEEEAEGETAVQNGLANMGLADFDLVGEDVFVPSLSEPPIPFTQVIIAFLYVMPIAFVNIFFTSSFMGEKLDKRLSVLLSTPARPIEIILGKMLPYLTFSLISVVVMTLILGGNVGAALLIFIPVILFMFAVYLMVPLFYRTFKDTTFISMLAVTVITAYLVFPAMFSGVNDFSYLSPLTLAVQMYQGEVFSLEHYLFATVPIVSIFLFALYIGTRVLNEEFLLGFRPLTRKLAQAVFLAMNQKRPFLSIFFLALCLVPIVYLIQLILLAISLNLPLQVALIAVLVASVLVEEIAKSVGIVVLYQRQAERPYLRIFTFALLSAVGFLVAEKLLLYLSLSAVSEAALSTAIFSGGLLLVPLLAHFTFTSFVCVLNARWHVRYPIAILAAGVLHVTYNLFVLGAAL
ncbi:MAG: ABC transporter permease [Ardenticatenaceae bacterium]|nr:ABC transporter permease [Ardenticatenaceae bacterium]